MFKAEKIGRVSECSGWDTSVSQQETRQHVLALQEIFRTRLLQCRLPAPNDQLVESFGPATLPVKFPHGLEPVVSQGMLLVQPETGTLQ
jgi:hypothetical protein